MHLEVTVIEESAVAFGVIAVDFVVEAVEDITEGRLVVASKAFRYTRKTLQRWSLTVK